MEANRNKRQYLTIFAFTTQPEPARVPNIKEGRKQN
jgi:hypothetical protein